MTPTTAPWWQGSLTLLCFHGIGEVSHPGDADEEEYWIPEDMFHRVLDLVGDRDDVGFSFDDGFCSDVEIALPALQERGRHGSFFPVSGRLDHPDFLGEAEIRRLAAAGMSVGVHGLTHRMWRDLTDAELVAELDESRRLLHPLTERPVTSAACPLGGYDRRVLRILRDQGFTSVFTSDRVRADPRWWVQPRFSLHRDDSLEDLQQLLSRRPPPRRRALDTARLLAKRLR